MEQLIEQLYVSLRSFNDDSKKAFINLLIACKQESAAKSVEEKGMPEEMLCSADMHEIFQQTFSTFVKVTPTRLIDNNTMCLVWDWQTKKGEVLNFTTPYQNKITFPKL